MSIGHAVHKGESLLLVRRGHLYQTSQELQILSSVTIDCQVPKIVMNSGSQLSELQSVSQMSQVSRTVFSKLSKIVFIVSVVKNYQKLPKIAKIVKNFQKLS